MERQKRKSKQASKHAQDTSSRGDDEQVPGSEDQGEAAAASSEITMQMQGKLWKRVEVQLLMRRGKSRNSCFIHVLFFVLRFVYSCS